jgi:cystathionine gamma-synthase
VVTAPGAYYGTLSLLSRLEQRGRLQVRLVDLGDPAAADEGLAGADLCWVESPTNPLLRLVDIAALAARTAARGARLAVDNTFATPIVQRPLETGADVVVHSATKYLSGHSDLLLGVVVARDPGVAEQLVAVRSSQGAVPGPVESWLALRGLRTLHLRVERGQANAAELAARLAGHPAVTRVHYPGLGAMVSLEVRGDAAAAERVATSTSLWVHATSLGGVESSLERRRRWTGESADVPETLVRLSVGVEDIDDLWADLAESLDAATR